LYYSGFIVVNNSVGTRS